jgi:hypothetical protein
MSREIIILDLTDFGDIFPESLASGQERGKVEWFRPKLNNNFITGCKSDDDCPAEEPFSVSVLEQILLFLRVVRLRASLLP